MTAPATAWPPPRAYGHPAAPAAYPGHADRPAYPVNAAPAAYAAYPAHAAHPAPAAGTAYAPRTAYADYATPLHRTGGEAPSWAGPDVLAVVDGPGTEAADAAAADSRTSRVRPYALTGGRTRSGHMLLVETFVATIERPDEPSVPAASPGTGGCGRAERFVPELREIVELCRHVRSVAEVSALLRIPLAAVRVLISDLADQGRIRVYGTGHGPGGPDRALLERVLSGLRRL